MDFLIIYLICINIFGVIVTVADKIAAKRGTRRTRERTLMLIASVGGAPLMYLTMLLIRHKTRKPLFMIGIPIIFVMELLVCFLGAKYVFKVF